MCFKKPGPRCPSYLANQAKSYVITHSSKVAALFEKGDHEAAKAEQENVAVKVAELDTLYVAGSRTLLEPITFLIGDGPNLTGKGTTLDLPYYNKIADRAERLEAKAADAASVAATIKEIAELRAFAEELEDTERLRKLANSLTREDVIKFNANLRLLAKRFESSDLITGMAAKGWNNRSAAERKAMTAKQIAEAKKIDVRAKKRYSNMAPWEKNMARVMLRVSVALKVAVGITDSIWKKRDTDIEKMYPARVKGTGKVATPKPAYR